MTQKKASLQIIQKLTATIQQFDEKGSENGYAKQVLRRVRNAVFSRSPLQLVMFTCSTINAEYLFSKTPWLYVSLDVKSNNLGPDLPRLRKILEKLRSIYPYIQITIVIGNTDPYYIYLLQFAGSSLAKKKTLWQKFSRRWAQYRENLDKWIKREYCLSDCTVISWYMLEKQIEKRTEIFFEEEFEKTLANARTYFTRQDLAWELQSLKKQFGPRRYFENLNQPSEQLLKEWIKRKFAEYAVQGEWIYEQFSNAILIQNEKPSSLRSTMYQPIVKEKYKDVLPIVYFFGVDDYGYQ